jgi:hypothetical protein
MVKRQILGMDFHFGIGFLSELIEGTGMNLNDLGTQDDTILMPKLMYYSNLYAKKRNDIAMDFTMNDLHDFIDDNGGVGGKFWIDFKIAFQAAMFKDVPTDDNKKKVKGAK